MRSYQCWKNNAPSAALLWLLVTVAAAVADQEISMGLPGCRTSCGGVTVPYPFGIKPGCSLKGFELTCDGANDDMSPRLAILNDMDRITEISLDESTVLVWLREEQAPSSKQMINNDDDNNQGRMPPPGGFFSFDQPRMHWMLLSSAMYQPNETRAGNEVCPKDLGVTACHSTHSTCQATSSDLGKTTLTGYTCRCDDGYQGNAYLSDGCKDIDECTLPNKCFGNCINLPGHYTCQCPMGTFGNPYVRNGCTEAHNPSTGLIIGIGVGSGGTLLSLVLGNTIIIRKIREQRKKKTRQRFFAQNRGQLLQQLVSQRADIAERMIVTMEELEKATNNFDRARELGGGGHGTVYKGILSNLHVVAIKKANIVLQREIHDFINEVAILSQINHKNVVKLLGCCLETEVPLLVYEFISNGTLHNHLHATAILSLRWRDRLRIAVEIAKALAYLHSLVSTPIIHRDVKSSNILLDDSLTIKLSDFGASRYVPIDQTGLDTTVQGTFGYLDPMYHSTGHLTEKSDVYSFGVILIELLTRKKPNSFRSPQGHGLVYHFVTQLSEGNLYHILDTQVVKEAGGEVVDVALLAKMCVKFISMDRPTMRQLEMTLEGIHAAREYASSPSDMTDESKEDYI